MTSLGIIQSAPKRYYPDSGCCIDRGLRGEVTEAELTNPKYQGYKTGQSAGKNGLERDRTETRREGVRFVEVDAMGRVVREAGARDEGRRAEPAAPLYT